MNTLTTLSSILLKSAININSFQYINSSKSLGIVLDTSGTAFTNNLGAGYATTAIGINPANQNTTCLTLRDGTTQATNTTMLMPNGVSSNFTVYLKHASRFYTDSIFGHGYALKSSATSVDAGNSFTVTFYSLYPTINLPYTISGVLLSDLSGASSLTGTFTSNYQAITFNTSSSIASTKNMVITFGTQSKTVSITVPEVKYVVGAVSQNMSAANGGFPGLVTTNTNTLFYSYDGITWTGLGQSIIDLVCLTVAYGNGVWVAGGRTSGTGSANDMAYSTNGINWTGLGIKFSAGVGYGNFATTSDFYVWGNGCLMVRYLGGYFVAVGNDYVSIVYSSNGINWTKVALPSTRTNYSTTPVITYTGSNWFVICYSEVFRSSNLSTWTSIRQTGEGGVGGNGEVFKNGSDYQLMTVSSLLLSTINNTVSAATSTPEWVNASTGARIGYTIFGGYGSTVVALNTMTVNYVTGSMPSDVGTIAIHVYNNYTYVDQFILYLPSSTKIYNVHNISFDTNLNKWIFAGDQGIMYKNTNTFTTSTADCAVTLLSTPTGAYSFGLGCKYIGARTY
jgi:hypothetical protein